MEKQYQILVGLGWVEDNAIFGGIFFLNRSLDGKFKPGDIFLR